MIASLFNLIRFVRSTWRWLAVLMLWWFLGYLTHSWLQGLKALVIVGVGMQVRSFLRWRSKRVAILRKYERPLPRWFEWGEFVTPKMGPIRSRRWRIVPRVGPVVWVYWWLAERSRMALCDWRWKEACQGLSLVGNDIWKSVPSLGFKEATVDRVNVVAYATPGAVKADVEKFLMAQRKMAGYFRHGCTDIVCTETGPGNMKVQIFFTEPDSRVTSLADLPVVENKRYLALGTRRDGTAILARKDHSMMLGAMTGMGKSNQIHVMVQQLLADGDHIWLYISDAAGGAELAAYGDKDLIGKPQGTLTVQYYAESAEDTVRMLAKARADMKIRHQWMGKNKIRRLDPALGTEANPRGIVILDEQVLIQTVYKKGTDSDLGAIYASGRKALFTVWGCTQDGRAETIPASLRSLIPTRWCGATDSATSTEVVLGPGAESKKGARCSTLNRDTDQGVFYTGAETAREFERGRAPYMPDDEVEMTAHGVIVPAMLERGKAKAQVQAIKDTEEYVLYRVFDNSAAWFDFHDSRPVYIGISNDWERRRAEHERDDWKWCDMHQRKENYWQVHLTDVTVTELGPIGFKAAEKIETLAIQTEFPVFNVKGNRGAHWKRTIRSWVQHAPKPSPALTAPELPPEPLDDLTLEGDDVLPEPTNADLAAASRVRKRRQSTPREPELVGDRHAHIDGAWSE